MLIREETIRGLIHTLILELLFHVLFEVRSASENAIEDGGNRGNCADSESRVYELDVPLPNDDAQEENGE